MGAIGKESSPVPSHNLERRGGNRILKSAEFLLCQGNSQANKTFLFEYQKYILLSLKKENMIDQEQLEECMIRLENNICKGKDHNR